VNGFSSPAAAPPLPPLAGAEPPVLAAPPVELGVEGVLVVDDELSLPLGNKGVKPELDPELDPDDEPDSDDPDVELGAASSAKT